jgi:hypothetical protein
MFDESQRKERVKERTWRYNARRRRLDCYRKRAAEGLVGLVFGRGGAPIGNGVGVMNKAEHGGQVGGRVWRNG